LAGNVGNPSPTQKSGSFRIAGDSPAKKLFPNGGGTVIQAE